MKEISAALVKAQKAFGPALKTSSNPHFKSKYADLAAVIEAVIDGLNANGIFLLQSTHECENGVIVETQFIHESGETISAGKLHVPASKHDAQGYGSALTYARRYSLMAACGVAPEDNDANAATKSPPVQKRNGPDMLTQDEIANIQAMCGEIGKPVTDITQGFKVSALNFIPRSHYAKIIERLEEIRSAA